MLNWFAFVMLFASRCDVFAEVSGVSLMGEILKDRDWNLSTHEWENMNSNKVTNNSIYFVDKYLEMFNSLKLMDSPIYDFELSFTMNEIA